MNDPEKIKSQSFFTPAGLLSLATEQVPAVKYAVGVGGIAAVVAIVLTGWQLEASAAIFGTLVVFVFMVVLVLFAALSKIAPTILKPLALVLAWAFLLLTITVAVLFVSCAFFDKPKTMPCLLQSKCNAPIPPVRQTISISGKVIDRNGQPIVNTKITIDAYDEFEALTTNNGKFINNLRDAKVGDVIKVRAYHDGYIAYADYKKILSLNEDWEIVLDNK